MGVELARDSLSVDELARDSLSGDELKDRCGSRGRHARKLELFSLEPARAQTFTVTVTVTASLSSVRAANTIQYNSHLGISSLRFD